MVWGHVSVEVPLYQLFQEIYRDDLKCIFRPKTLMSCIFSLSYPREGGSTARWGVAVRKLMSCASDSLFIKGVLNA